MKNTIRLGAVLTLGAAMLLPTLATAEAGLSRSQVRFNFTSASAAKAARAAKAAKAAAAQVARSSKTSKTSKARKRRAGTSRRPGSAPARRRAGYAACRAAARRFGVPVATALAVCRLESGFRCNAVGRAGELGLLQIKLATARALGYRGSRRGLLRCSTGAYWGMKHLARAIRMGGVWKHNAGLHARRPNAQARKYARKVAALRQRYL